MTLPDNGGVPVFGRLDLLQALFDRFPTLSGRLQEDDGIHIQMAALGEEVMSALQSGELSLAFSVLQFLDGVLGKSPLDDEISNAVAISFVDVDELAASTLGRQLLDAMPPRVTRELAKNKNR